MTKRKTNSNARRNVNTSPVRNNDPEKTKVAAEFLKNSFEAMTNAYYELLPTMGEDPETARKIYDVAGFLDHLDGLGLYPMLDKLHTYSVEQQDQIVFIFNCMAGTLAIRIEELRQLKPATGSDAEVSEMQEP
jgi:hypothetical protein